MKVLSCFLDNRFGGPQRRGRSVAERLRVHGIETVFLFNEKRPSHIPVKYFKGFLIQRLQMLTHKSMVLNFFLFLILLPKNLYRICTIIRAEEIDVVHTNGIMNFLPAVAAKLSGAKVIWHLNDTLTPWIIRKPFLLLVKLFSDRIALAAKAVGMLYFGNSKMWYKSTILYAPVDVDKYHRSLVDSGAVERLKVEFGIRPNYNVIGALGNVNFAKGYEYFIRAARQIQDHNSKTKFLIVGAKLETKLNYWEELQNLVSELELKNDIVFTGFREDMTEILSMLDVFVLSSVSEACPVAVLEAMAMEVPVVATNVGGVSEQILNGQTGLIVEPRKPDKLADAVLDLLDKPRTELEKMVNIGRQRAENLFALEITVKKHKDIYEEMLSN